MSPEMDNYRIPHQRNPRARVSVEEQFARLLEVESMSAAREGAEGNLGRLLAVAGALRTAGVAAGPAPLSVTSKAAMRQRLVAVATVSDPQADHPSRRASVTNRLHRRLVALAGTFTVVTSVAGVGVAAAHSLPGDPFYDVKRATESVQLWATQGEAAKGRLHLEFARTRLAEAEKLPVGSSHIASTLAAMNTQTTQGSRELLSAYRSSHSMAPLATLVTFTQQQYADLTTLAQQLPPTLHATEVAALSVLTGVTGTLRTVTGQRCLTCIVTGAANPDGSHPTTPIPQRTSSPSAPTTGPTPHETTAPPSTATGSNQTPTKTPSSLLPTDLIPSHLVPSNLVPSNLVPTKLRPSSLLPSLLGNGTHHKHPSTGLLSPILNSLGL